MNARYQKEIRRQIPAVDFVDHEKQIKLLLAAQFAPVYSQEAYLAMKAA